MPALPWHPMRILLDESVPGRLGPLFGGARREFSSTDGLGWAGIKNRRLLALAAADFDVLLTADKGIEYQLVGAHQRLSRPLRLPPEHEQFHSPAGVFGSRASAWHGYPAAPHAANALVHRRGRRSWDGSGPRQDVVGVYAGLRLGRSARSSAQRTGGGSRGACPGLVDTSG